VPIQVAIITGEASGDRIGGLLAREIKKLRPDAVLYGTGGKYLKEAGVEVLVDSSRWGVVGVAAGLKILPRVLAARSGLFQELQRRKPDVVVPVDAGAFNVGFGPIEGLCSVLRRTLPDTKILYFFPPGSWRRTLRETPLARLTDKVATPFPWSETELRRLGVDASFVGHPLLDLVRPSEPMEAFTERHGIDRERPVVGILPGSRSQEIEQVLPIQLAAATIIHHRVPAAQFLIALAPTVDREAVLRQIEREKRNRETAMRRAQEAQERDREWKEEGLRGVVIVPAEGGQGVGAPNDLQRRQQEWIRRHAEMPPVGDYPLAIVENATYDVMAASDVLLITSGTATLEAAILGKPMVIVYRLSRSNIVEYQFVKNRLPKYIGMPNILAEKGIVPEYIQDDATPDALAGEVIGLLLEPERMLKMREDLQAATALLGEPGGAARTAKMVVELAESAGRSEEQGERQAGGDGS
jgi:lipid-A-disaccharide synthase